MTIRTAVLALATLSGVGALPAQEAPLPAHPRDLVFPEATWRPPDASALRHELPGGATAYVLTDRSLPLVDLVVVARNGGHLDPPGLRGLAEMTTTLLRRGGAGDRSSEAFDRRADELGARLFSVPTMLYGAAGLRCTSDVVPEALDLLLDMLASPRFEEARWRNTVANTREALSRRNLDSRQVLEREFDWLLFGERHFSTRPIRSSDLQAMTPAELAAFHRRHWAPSGFVLAVAGDIDAEQLRGHLASRLRDWPGEPDGSAAPPWPPPGPDEPARAGLFHIDADIPQARFLLGHRAPVLPATVKERVELEVVAEILGGRGAISRLGGRLRSSEGLVYSIAADFDPGDLWPGSYRIRFDTRADQAARALQATLQELRRMIDTVPKPGELETVKLELKARRRQEFDTAEEAVGLLVQDALVGRPAEYRSDYERLLDAVTPEAVAAAAARHLNPDALTIVVAGRWDELAGAVYADGRTELERIAGSSVEPLPTRDPLTLAQPAGTARKAGPHSGPDS